ncbi:MAG: hypothetical protein LW701_03535 [Fluviicola sp.]|nr:hypothetical protein [Fluviicola sp.]
MKFIPFSILHELLEINEFDENIDYIEIFNQKNLENIKFNNEIISTGNWKEILKLLNHPKSQLFFSWVETNKSLSEFLTLKHPNKLFKDTFQHLNHGFSSEFRDFISPFVSDEILSNTSISDIKRAELNSSFLCLLNDQFRSKVEIEFVSLIKVLLSSISDELKNNSIEDELVKKITPICSSEIVSILNQLSRSNYAIKIQYVDQLLSVIHFKGCTVRFANWILNQLKNIDLNKEHFDKIEQLSNELSKGKIHVKNNFESVKSSNQTKNKRLAFIGIIIFAIISISILYFKPFESKKHRIVSEHSAYEQFTVAERKEIDSILKSIEASQNDNTEVDQDSFFGESASLYSEHKFKNEKMSKLYTDLILDAAFETIDFEVNLYDEFLFIPGSKFGPFVSPKVAKDQLPSSSYRHHFNQVDFNYVNGIKQVYRMNMLNDHPLIINAIGSKDGIFEIEDNSGGLLEI